MMKVRPSTTVVALAWEMASYKDAQVKYMRR